MGREDTLYIPGWVVSAQRGSRRGSGAVTPSMTSGSIAPIRINLAIEPTSFDSNLVRTQLTTPWRCEM